MSVGAVVACCALAAACTQEPAQTSSPSPTPLATTPRESQIERQMRLDYEAAELAYRANIAEQDRLYQAGGADRGHSCARRRPLTGSYLRITLKSLRDVHDAGWRRHGDTKILGIVRDGGWKGDRVGLTSCEDNEIVTFLDKSGKDVTPGGLARLRSGADHCQGKRKLESVGSDDKEGKNFRGPAVRRIKLPMVFGIIAVPGHPGFRAIGVS